MFTERCLSLWQGGKGGAAGAGLGIAGGMYYGPQQNAKGGGDGAQLASLRQVPRLLQRILLFAKYIQPL